MKPEICMRYGPVNGEPPYQCDCCKKGVYGVTTIRMHQKYNFCDNCMNEFVTELIGMASFSEPGGPYATNDDELEELQ